MRFKVLTHVTLVIGAVYVVWISIASVRKLVSFIFLTGFTLLTGILSSASELVRYTSFDLVRVSCKTII